MKATIELKVTLTANASTRQGLQRIISEWVQDVKGYGVSQVGTDCANASADVFRIRKGELHIVQRTARIA